jgi:hypothetical protein
VIKWHKVSMVASKKRRLEHVFSLEETCLL